MSRISYVFFCSDMIKCCLSVTKKMDNKKDLVIISESTRFFMYGHTVHSNKKLAKYFHKY